MTLQQERAVRDFPSADMRKTRCTSAHTLVMAKDVFDLVLAGKITSEPKRVFPLEQASEAHRALESRATSGATVLVP
jgi:NADPH:quinone reductase-like Zn-dependent oxidoreductase